ncbi:hypothetical protein SARC_01611 [Sphaeroforma arctica JP610]|uniref:Uncharacterized protein n=1 Tax=Sphaeroforma arctica JP610 TaxID=667725 RepID=A0A0L0GBG3_9EUKA|nr:hypothetical protein SARC_01611 [Sphaeroforma arctica JP610]KNC86236.1 hypothetical protein SARC_01611 [Sphaeroforma arctica JP610]|eukprot:XP_014160138.1 hypothetical protein SARC_01611 [Sphaeroforma arctica JP610]
MSQRRQQLESMPAYLPPAVKLAVVSELRALQLFELQQSMRRQLTQAMQKDTFPQTALNRQHYRRPKKQMIRGRRMHVVAGKNWTSILCWLFCLISGGLYGDSEFFKFG